MTRARRLLLNHAKDNCGKNDHGPYDKVSDESDFDRLQRDANHRGSVRSWPKSPFALKLQFLNSLYVGL